MSVRSTWREVKKESLLSIPTNEIDCFLREGLVDLILDARLGKAFRKVASFDNAIVFSWFAADEIVILDEGPC